MYFIKLMNNKGQIFEKKFDSYYLFNKFRNKVKRSKKLISITEWREM